MLKKLIITILCGLSCFISQKLYAEEKLAKVPDALKDEVENLHRLDQDVYRSGQPSKKEFQLLEKHGVKSILNLREYHCDEKKAKNTKLTLIRYPVAAGEVTEEDLLNCLTIINRSPKPILIHCWHGSDRTGVICAAYRIAVQGWKVDDAIKEFKKPELGYHAFWYPKLPTLLKGIDWKAFREKLKEKSKD